MPPLTHQETIVLNMLLSAATNNRPCPSNLDFEMALNVNSTSTAPNIIASLEEKGWIEVTRYQRAREVRIPHLNLETAPHPNRKTDRPHVPRGFNQGAHA